MMQNKLILSTATSKQNILFILQHIQNFISPKLTLLLLQPSATVMLPLVSPFVRLLSLNHLSDALSTCQIPFATSVNPPPYPKILFPPPGLTSPWRHVGASSSAPNYSLANSSAETTSNCYETKRNNLRP